MFLVTFFDPEKSIVENLYFLASIFLLVGLAITYYQVQQTRKSILLHSYIESSKLTFDIMINTFSKFSDEYEKIAQLMDNIMIDSNKIEYLDLTDLSKIEKTNKHYDEYLKIRVILEKNDKEDNELKMIYATYDLMDKLETFSTLFTENIGNEKLAYRIDNEKFIQYCNLCAPQIIFSRSKNLNPDLYHNTIKLYNNWFSKNQVQKQNVLKTKAEKEIEDLSKNSEPFNEPFTLN